jgi:hypothetical protein
VVSLSSAASLFSASFWSFSFASRASRSRDRLLTRSRDLERDRLPSPPPLGPQWLSPPPRKLPRPRRMGEGPRP